MMHFFPVSRIKVTFVAAVVSLLAGCATMRYGGAPEPSFSVKTDLEQLTQQFGLSTSINDYYISPSQAARNKFIVGRLTLMNLRYLQFICNLTSERQLLDSATAITLVGLGLAGSTVPLAQTKTILSAIAAGVAGSKEAIDKNYYFEKTIPALVAQMNAERKKTLVPLMAGMRSSLEDYPFEQAICDLHDYYNAGTFSGAIQGIQVEAAGMEQKQDKIIASLTPLPQGQIDTKKRLTEAIGRLTNQTDMGKIKKAIEILDPSVTPPEDLEKAKIVLQAYVRGARTSARIAEVTSAFEQSGIIITGE
jgi:hypothetical protein